MQWVEYMKTQAKSRSIETLVETYRGYAVDQEAKPSSESTISRVPLFFENRIALSISEAAFMLGISTRTVERLIQKKELNTKRVGRRLLISKDELGAWLNRKE